MKTEYTLSSAKELTPEIIESIKLAFADKPIKITVEDISLIPQKSTSKELLPKEITDTVIDIILNQLSKSKTKKPK